MFTPDDFVRLLRTERITHIHYLAAELANRRLEKMQLSAIKVFAAGKYEFWSTVKQKDDLYEGKIVSIQKIES